MRFKLDENADPRWKTPLQEGGHDVSTVSEEDLQGATDPIIAQTCKDLDLCLVTVDLGFAQILEYPPNEYAGIIVLRHRTPSLTGMMQLMNEVTVALRTRSPRGQLWIFEPGRIRIHGIPQEEDSYSHCQKE